MQHPWLVQNARRKLRYSLNAQIEFLKLENLIVPTFVWKRKKCKVVPVTKYGTTKQLRLIRFFMNSVAPTQIIFR